MRGLGGLLASRLGRLAGTGFGFGRGQTWQQIVDENEVGWYNTKCQEGILWYDPALMHVDVSV